MPQSDTQNYRQCLLLPSLCYGEKCCLECLIEKIAQLNAAVGALKKLSWNLSKLSKKHLMAGAKRKIDETDLSIITVSYERTGLLGDDLLRELIHMHTTASVQEIENYKNVLEESVESLQGVLKAFSRRVKNGSSMCGAGRADICLEDFIVFDIAGFKGFNDAFSMDVGDVVISELRGIIEKRVSSCDPEYRVLNYAGDEYLAVKKIKKDESCFCLKNKGEFAPLSKKEAKNLKKLLNWPTFNAPSKALNHKEAVRKEDIAAVVCNETQDEKIIIEVERDRFNASKSGQPANNKPFFVISGLKLHHGWGDTLGQALTSMNNIKESEKRDNPERGELQNKTYIKESLAEKNEVDLKRGLMYFIRAEIPEPENGEPYHNLEKELNSLDELKKRFKTVTETAFDQSVYKIFESAIDKIEKNYAEYFENIPCAALKSALGELSVELEKRQQITTAGEKIEFAEKLLSAVRRLFGACPDEDKECRRIMANCTNDIWNLLMIIEMLEDIGTYKLVGVELEPQNEYSMVYFIKLRVNESRIVDFRREVAEALKDKIDGLNQDGIWKNDNVMFDLTVENCSLERIFPKPPK